LAELHAKLKSFVMEKKAPTPSEPTTTHETVKPPPLPTPTPTHGETPVLPPPGAEVGKPGDPFTLAQALFRAGEYSAALQSYRRIEQEGLALQEKAVVQYMTASCLRKLGKLEDAAALYREVANARDDEVLTDCALWQLNSINWRRDLQKQLEEVRQRREALK